MVRRLGYTWKIPLTEAEFKVGNQTMSIPYLSPIEIMKFLLTSAAEILFGGFAADVDISALLSSFWHHYKNVHPGHACYTQHPDGAATPLSSTIPVILFGDEGRGRRRGNTALVSMEFLFGLGTSENYSNNNSCFDCKHCNLTNDNTLRTHVDRVAFANTNYKEHSFLSKVPLFFVHCSVYKKHPDLIEFMVGKICSELRQLFFEGITVRGRVWTVALLGMKGDLKWHVQIGRLQRHYGTKGRKRSLAMCPECYAGIRGYPYEDVGSCPKWTHTLWRARPWDENEPPTITIAPFDSAQPERVLRRDPMHITKLGIFRHHVASTLILLVHWKYFAIPGKAHNDASTQLERAHGHFKLWALTFGHTPSLRSFTRYLFNWNNNQAFPWANVKASDCILLNRWLQDLLPMNIRETAEGHRDRKIMIEVMLKVSQAASEFTQLIYGHKLFLNRACCSRLVQLGQSVINGYTWLAKETLPLPVCGWAVVPKVHSFRHFIWDIKLFLQSGPAALYLSPLAFANDMNEDVIGKCCRLSRRVTSTLMPSRVLELYLIKAQRLHSRWLERTRS